MKLPRRLISTPIRPDRWTAMRFASLRWAALPVIDRRWTVPLSAMALAFGIFVGVAIGPATEGSLGSQMQTLVSVVSPPATAPPVDPGGTGGPPGGSGRDGDQDNPDPEPTPAPPIDNDPFDTPAPTTPAPAPTTPTTPTPTTTTTTPDTDDEDDDDDGEDPVPTLVKGAVVHANEVADSYTVARNDGTLTSVHAQNLPALGDVIAVETKTLANGTRAENGDRDQTDKTDRFDLAGTVTFSDPRIGAYTLSVPGSSFVIRVPAGTRMPQVADRVEVSARIADKLDPIEDEKPGRDGCGTPPRPPKPRKFALEQTDLTVTDRASSTAIEAIVQGVCRKEGSLILSADDVRESGRDIAVVVPTNLQLSDITPGQVVKIRADIGSNGNLTATAMSDDGGESAANDPDRIQP